jgi:hypothetical protein
MGDGPFYFKRQYAHETTPTFFEIKTTPKVVSTLKYPGDNSPKTYMFGYFDNDEPRNYHNVDNIPIGSIYELKSNREKIKAAALEKSRIDYEDLASRMEPVTKSDLRIKGPLTYYYNGSKYVYCEIKNVPFLGDTIKIKLNDEVRDVDLSTLFRPKPKAKGGRRWKKTKKGGYKHKKSNRKQKYHSRKVRKPKNRNGRTYSKRRS